jgi:hypothetical protein
VDAGNERRPRGTARFELAFLVTAVGLISVLLATDTTPTSYPVTTGEVSRTIAEPTSTAVLAVPCLPAGRPRPAPRCLNPTDRPG